jgi:hypothetical protein
MVLVVVVDSVVVDSVVVEEGEEGEVVMVALHL